MPATSSFNTLSLTLTLDSLCYFGTDIPSEDQLVASGRTVDEICKYIEADSLGYLRLERLSEMVDGLPVCRGCFTGEYPLDPPTEDIRGEYDR